MLIMIFLIGHVWCFWYLWSMSKDRKKKERMKDAKE